MIIPRLLQETFVLNKNQFVEKQHFWLDLVITCDPAYDRVFCFPTPPHSLILPVGRRDLLARSFFDGSSMETMVSLRFLGFTKNFR